MEAQLGVERVQRHEIAPEHLDLHARWHELLDLSLRHVQRLELAAERVRQWHHDVERLNGEQPQRRTKVLAQELDQLHDSRLEVRGRAVAQHLHEIEHVALVGQRDVEAQVLVVDEEILAVVVVREQELGARANVLDGRRRQDLVQPCRHGVVRNRRQQRLDDRVLGRGAGGMSGRQIANHAAKDLAQAPHGRLVEVSQLQAPERELVGATEVGRHRSHGQAQRVDARVLCHQISAAEHRRLACWRCLHCLHDRFERRRR